MPCVIGDREVAFDAGNTPRPTVGALGHVTATPTLAPLWVTTSPGEDEEDQSAGGVRLAPIDPATGAWSLVLPWPSVCTPSTVRFTIRRANGDLFSGAVPEGVAGPLTVWDLVTGHDWGLVASGARPAPVTAIVGTQRGVPSVYNVKDYGARGDGAADDSAAIAAAVAAAHAAGGGVVYLPPGTYGVSMPAGGGPCIKLYGGITLRGAGRGATTITLAATTAVGHGDHFVYIVGNNAWAGGQPADLDIAVDDLTVDGNAVNFSTPGGGKWTGGIRLVNTRHATLRNVTVKNIFGDGTGPNQPVGYWESFAVDVEQSLDTTHVNCIATSDDGGSTASGFAINTSSNVQYVGCIAHDMTVTQGWAFYEATSVLCASCSSYRNGGFGWSMDTCADVRFVGCRAGGETDFAANPWFAAHSPLGNGRDGWLIDSSTATPSTSVDLVACTGRHNAGAGLTVGHGDRISVVGGDYSGNGANGIALSLNATNIFLSPDIKHDANTSADLALSGIPVASTVRGSGALFNKIAPPAFTATVGTAGAVGASLLPGTTYTYTLTVQTTAGEQSTAGPGVSATTGATAHPIALSWGPFTGDHVVVYRDGVLLHAAASGAGGWVDDGTAAPTSTAPPVSNRTGRVVAGSLHLTDVAPSVSDFLIDARVSGATRFTVDRFGGMVASGGVNSFPSTALANSTVGLVQIGPGAFGAVGGGNFDGSAQGTLLALHAIGGFAGNALDVQVAGARKFLVDTTGAAQISGAATLSAGTGAPAQPAGGPPAAGDYYLRIDATGTPNSRLYVCTVGGATPTWVGIV